MINPPYSLDKKDKSSGQEYPIIQEINELKDKNKKLIKKIRDLNPNAYIDASRSTPIKLFFRAVSYLSFLISSL